MLRTVFVLGLLLGAVVPAGAFSVRVFIPGAGTHWQESTLDYYIQYAGSDDLTPEESMGAVHAAFDSWRNVDCSELDFNELGDAPNPNATVLTGSAPNGKNELVWVEDEAWTLGKWVLGVTGPIISQNGTIVEADIAFNGLWLHWSLDGLAGPHLEAVALHEIGHMFGLQHNLGPVNNAHPPTMTPNAHPGSETLEQDDAWGACFLYPLGGTWFCDNAWMCPKILSKDGNGDDVYVGAFLCDPESHTCEDTAIWNDTSNLGESCTLDAMCVGDSLCGPWMGGGICTSLCHLQQDECPAQFTCEPMAGFPGFGLCIPEGGAAFSPGDGPLGCASSQICAPDHYCLPTPAEDKKLCASVCALDDAESCPEGQRCWDYGMGKSNGACFDLAEWPAESLPADDLGTDALESEEDLSDEADGGAETGTEILAEEIVSDAEGTPPSTPTGGCGRDAQPTGTPWLLGGLLILALTLRRRRDPT